ncbi:VOC family protein [Aureibaculum sp. 2210JD6-5]|uniref:VOC family protein n=1 Tax=Aureibaculum sp. 2210JD6-5 TaxID=3103957 RepID=UPI002AAD83E0|nr:VOC family protein [Aureibaculum sp. 2210JD6-5]MDY7395069.1 VOC family protein [Aureibaculum sp. 2210JD6-5]
MKSIILGVIIMAFSLISCKNKNTSISETNINDSTQTKNVKNMNSFISIFEIPATDISRAIGFYQEILGINIEKMDFPEMEMGLFPYQDQLVTGVIMKGEGYQPSSEGVTIYLNGGDNLQVILDKVDENGGKTIIPKTPHADESGFFAIFHDSEGNKIGLHSPN